MSTNIFPRNDYNVEVCAHRWDKHMTYVESTDTLSNNNYMPLMLWFFRNNVRAGIFSWIVPEAQLKAAKELELCGIVNNSLYCTMGSSTQRTMNINARIMRETFKKFFGRYPSTYSYAGSDESYYRQAASYFNAGRDNDYADFGHPYTFYGYDFQSKELLGSLEVPVGGGSPVYPERTGFDRFDEMKHFMSMRIPSEVGNKAKFQHGYTWQDVLNLAIADFRTTYGNRGFYNNFCHWHDLGGGVKLDVSVLQYKDYVDALGSLTVNNVDVSDNIHFCGFDEAMEYMMARILLKKISCYTPIGNPEEVHIVGYFNNDVSPLFRMDCFNTPLTIKVNLVGTPLEGEDIKVDYGNVVKVANNIFLVELPVPRTGNISGIVLSKTNGSDYVITTRPTITATEEGATPTVTIVPFTDDIESYSVSSNNYVNHSPGSYMGEIAVCSPGTTVKVRSKMAANNISYVISFWSKEPVAQEGNTTPQEKPDGFISGVKARSADSNVLADYEAVAPAGTAYVVVSSAADAGAGWREESQVGPVKVIFTCSSHYKGLLNFCIFRKAENATEDTAAIIQYEHGVNTVEITKETGYVYAAGVSANYGNGHYVVTALSSWV